MAVNNNKDTGSIDYRTLLAVPFPKRQALASAGLIDLIARDLTPGQRVQLFPRWFALEENKITGQPLGTLSGTTGAAGTTGSNAGTGTSAGTTTGTGTSAGTAAQTQQPELTAGQFRALEAAGLGGYVPPTTKRVEAAAQKKASAGGIPTIADVEAYIIESAKKRGVDPEIALKVARSEGLTSTAGPAGAFRSDVNVKDYGKEDSWGAFQLLKSHKGKVGGVGYDMLKETGIDPADPNNWKQSIDYALNRVIKKGWGEWNGAKKLKIFGKAGVTKDSQILPITPLNSQTTEVATSKDDRNAMQILQQEVIAKVSSGKKEAPSAVEIKPGQTFDVSHAGKYTADMLIKQGVSSNYASNIATKLNELDPSIQHRYANAMIGLQKKYGSQGYEFDIHTAYRSVAQQAALKTDGRKASPGGSWHNYKSAIDIRVIKNGKYDDGTGKSGEAPYTDKVWTTVRSYGLKGGLTDDVGHIIPLEFSQSVPKSIQSGQAPLSSLLTKDYPGDVPIKNVADSTVKPESQTATSDSIKPVTTDATAQANVVPSLATGGTVPIKDRTDALIVGPKPDLPEKNIKSIASYRLDNQGVYDSTGKLLFTKRSDESIKQTEDGNLKIDSFAMKGKKQKKNKKQKKKRNQNSVPTPDAPDEILLQRIASGGKKYTVKNFEEAGFVSSTPIKSVTINGLNSLHPDVRDRMFNLIVDAQKDLMAKKAEGKIPKGLENFEQVGLGQGARSVKKQMAAQKSATVAAEVGRSLHQFALSGDIAIFADDGTQLSADYFVEDMRDIGRKHGLDNLIGNDIGHFQPIGIGSLAKDTPGKYEFNPMRDELVSSYGKMITKDKNETPKKTEEEIKRVENIVSDVVSGYKEYQIAENIAPEYNSDQVKPTATASTETPGMLEQPMQNQNKEEKSAGQQAAMKTRPVPTVSPNMTSIGSYIYYDNGTAKWQAAQAKNPDNEQIPGRRYGSAL